MRRRACKENDQEPTEWQRRARSGRLWERGTREGLRELAAVALHWGMPAVANKLKHSLEVKQEKN